MAPTAQKVLSGSYWNFDIIHITDRIARNITVFLYFTVGIDSETAYTKTDVRSQELTGDQELHKQINKPDNMCAKLALDTHGSFFNLQKLKEGRVRYQKHFMDVFARRVAKTAQSEECSVCECSDEGVKVCKPCDVSDNNKIWLKATYVGKMSQ